MIDFSLPEFDHDGHMVFYKLWLGVTIYDHWLSREELEEKDAHGFMEYSEAKDRGLIDEYEAIERRFLAFFESIIGPKVVLFNRHRYRWQRVTKIKLFRGFRSEVRRLLTHSLRTIYCNNSDFYIPHLKLRVFIRSDFTTGLYFEDVAFAPLVREKATAAGLFVLE